MARKIKVYETFQGLISDGDLVRFFTDDGDVDATLLKHDSDGDASVTVPGLRGSIWIAVSDCTHVKILKAAPKPKATTIGGVTLTVLRGVAHVRGSVVSDECLLGVALAYELVDGLNNDDGEITAASVLQAYADRRIRIDPDTGELRAGCVTFSKEDAIAALTWIAQQLGWDDW